MSRYVVLRLAQAIITIWAVVTLVFLLVRLGGDPAALLAPPGSSKTELNEISRSLGLDQPLYVQYGRYLIQLGHGDLGQSFAFRTSVLGLIEQTLPYTAELALVAYLFASIVGVGLGTFSALRSGGLLDVTTKVLAVIGQSVPSFWLGIILILFFAVRLRLVPAIGAGTPIHLVLPALALGLHFLASIMRLTRSATLDVLDSDYIVFQRSKGVRFVVFLRHIMRNVSVPVVTLSGVQLGQLLSGTVVVETLFAWPGMGQLAIQAIELRDYNVIEGVVIVATVIFVALSFGVDLLSGLLDPRVRVEAGGRWRRRTGRSIQPAQAPTR